MSTLNVVGGVYHEHCTWPQWERVFGSGGRGAAAAAAQSEVTLKTLMDEATKATFDLEANVHGFECQFESTDGIVSFDYLHPLASPIVANGRKDVPQPTLHMNETNVLRFGMLETEAVVEAERCVYDPQSPGSPAPFGENGSRCENLAIVANERETLALAGETDLDRAAETLLSGADILLVKQGMSGASIYTRGAAPQHVPAFASSEVFSIGSGDVFAGVFASAWAAARLAPYDAAVCASRAVADYVETQSLPSKTLATLAGARREPASVSIDSVYLASPFFTMAERMMVDETRSALEALGLQVFSPFHEIGPGPADIVAPADLAALERCDAVFALIDGLDAGTIFEIGYATALKKPVHCLCQNVSEGDLKMIEGSGGKVHFDLVTAAYRTAWNR